VTTVLPDTPDLYWPFTGAADTCYLTHDNGDGYRECCMRAGLAYALKLREQQIREQFALDLESASNRYDQDSDVSTGEPRAVLRAKAEVLWEAAVRIRTATTEGA